jgi:sugar phosphate isomerase/epimerase
MQWNLHWHTWKKKMIYISSGGDKNRTGEQFARAMAKLSIYNIELSGGAYDKSQLEKLKTMKKMFNFQVHNYFPPPEIPFVLNIASFDENIAKLSIDHILRAMQWSVELDNPTYSFHAGFLIDPKVDELGRTIKKPQQLNDRTQALTKFLDRLQMLSKEASKLGVNLLLENNVLTKANLTRFVDNPLLMVTEDECEYVMNNTPENIGLLIDVAHLKVSSNTLKFDPTNFLRTCEHWISGYHLSDNDGLADSNMPIGADSWFWGKLRENINNITIEVYSDNLEVLSNQSKMVENILG